MGILTQLAIRKWSSHQSRRPRESLQYTLNARNIAENTVNNHVAVPRCGP